MKITQDVRGYAGTPEMGVDLRQRTRMQQKSAEFRPRGGEVFRPAEMVGAADAEGEEPTAAD